MDTTLAELVYPGLTPEDVVRALTFALATGLFTQARVLTVWLVVAEEEGGTGYCSTKEVARRAEVGLATVIETREFFEKFFTFGL